MGPVGGIETIFLFDLAPKLRKKLWFSFLLDFLKKSRGHVAPILKIPGSFMMEAVAGYRRGHPLFEATIGGACRGLL